jgi:hypothetical protein
LFTNDDKGGDCLQTTTKEEIVYKRRQRRRLFTNDDKGGDDPLVGRLSYFSLLFLVKSVLVITSFSALYKLTFINIPITP